MARRSAAALLFLLAAPAPALAEQQVFLGQVPVEAAPGVTLSADGPVVMRLELRPGDPARLAGLESRMQVKRGQDSATLFLAGYPGGRDQPAPQHSQPSFLVDFDEAPVQALREPVLREAGAHPGPEQLAAFVARYIEKKNYSRGADPASVVARRREGDCKAHAVLLAALARMFGIPARIVVGLALVGAKDRFASFGHAWVEVHSKSGWRAIDAVGPAASAVMVRLPLSAVSDEGPGYMLSFLGGLSLLDVREVKLLRDERAADAALRK
jgi:transglutaminase-like putative cysteine protease